MKPWIKPLLLMAWGFCSAALHISMAEIIMFIALFCILSMPRR